MSVSPNLLEVNNLSVGFETERGLSLAVDDISFVVSNLFLGISTSGNLKFVPFNLKDKYFISNSGTFCFKPLKI